jgi:hypothetical protein
MDVVEVEGLDCLPQPGDEDVGQGVGAVLSNHLPAGEGEDGRGLAVEFAAACSLRHRCAGVIHQQPVPFIQPRLQHVEGDADRQAVVEAIAGEVGGAVVCFEGAQRVALELVGGVASRRVDIMFHVHRHRIRKFVEIVTYSQIIENIRAIYSGFT